MTSGPMGTRREEFAQLAIEPFSTARDHLTEMFNNLVGSPTRHFVLDHFLPDSTTNRIYQAFPRTTEGHRVSRTEVEEVIYETKLAGEVAALGIPHPVLGQAIVVVRTPRDGDAVDTDTLLAEYRRRLPAYMVPALVEPHEQLAAQSQRQDGPQAAGKRNSGSVRSVGTLSATSGHTRHIFRR